jgi:hypothetical protein
MDMNPSQMQNTYTFSIQVIERGNEPSGISPEAAQYFNFNGDEFQFNNVKINKNKLVGKITASVSDID